MSSYVPKITSIGLHGDAEDTLAVVFKFNGTQKYVDYFEYDANYYMDDNFSSTKKFVLASQSQITGGASARTLTFSYSTADTAGAKYVRVRIRAVSKKTKKVTKTTTKNGKKTTTTSYTYWFGGSDGKSNWSDYKKINITKAETTDVKPDTPSAPSLEIVENNKLKMSLDNLTGSGTHIDFSVCTDNDSASATVFTEVAISTNHAEALYEGMVEGHTYKVRARSIRSTGSTTNREGDWSDWSDEVSLGPAAISGISSIAAESSTSVKISWPAASGSTSYELGYATELSYFNGSDALSVESGITTLSYIKTGLETGQRYYFAVRAVNSYGTSAWTTPVEIVLGKKPSAPTTWSSTTTVSLGDTVNFYWVHNSQDGSSQVSAQLQLTINDVEQPVITIQNSTDEDLKDKTSSYSYDTSQLSSEASILWKVCTCGVTGEYGEWSVQRKVTVYQAPTLSVVFSDISNMTLAKFPINLSLYAGPSTQTPLGYQLEITAAEDYEAIDSLGQDATIINGQTIFSKYYASNLLEYAISLSAGDIDLSNGVRYNFKITLSMSTGLTASVSQTVTMDFEDEGTYSPSAEFTIDYDNVVVGIHPYCTRYDTELRVVSETTDKSGNEVYEVTDTVFDGTVGNPVIGGVTTEGSQVYEGATSDGTDALCCEYIASSGIYDDVTLTVYRRESDGGFTQIGESVENSDSETATIVTDPHPSLDYARYRIVAKIKATGNIVYYDTPSLEIGESDIIIQWDETYQSYHSMTDPDGTETVNMDAGYNGTMLRLPYNIDTTDNNTPDSSLVEYIGRKNPVSYYGTQRGVKATWNVDIEANDAETIYQLRRLSAYMGDVYVREPSGTGYWANLTVSFSKKHSEVSIPVTLNITKVEGGE